MTPCTSLIHTFNKNKVHQNPTEPLKSKRHTLISSASTSRGPENTNREQIKAGLKTFKVITYVCNTKSYKLTNKELISKNKQLKRDWIAGLLAALWSKCAQHSSAWPDTHKWPSPRHRLPWPISGHTLLRGATHSSLQLPLFSIHLSSSVHSKKRENKNKGVASGQIKHSVHLVYVCVPAALWAWVCVKCS